MKTESNIFEEMFGQFVSALKLFGVFTFVMGTLNFFGKGDVTILIAGFVPLGIYFLLKFLKLVK